MKYISFLIKPASSLCNMRCRYCFYYDVADHREVRSHGIMQEDTMQALIEPGRRADGRRHRLLSGIYILCRCT